MQQKTPFIELGRWIKRIEKRNKEEEEDDMSI